MSKKYKPKKKAKRQAPVIESLEPRIMMSADLPGLDTLDISPDDPLDVDIDRILAQAEEAFLTAQNEFGAGPAESTDEVAAVVPAEEPEVLLPSSELPDDIRRELIIVDPSVPDYELLLAGVNAVGGEDTRLNVVVLDPYRSGIEQISEILASRSGLGAIHLISHGSDAAIQIGGDTLDLALLQSEPEAISGWGGALSEEGDILIYGCNVAETEEGQVLIDALAEMTRADVAASDDLTGHDSLGGDWDLEYQAGEVETEIAITQNARLQWLGTLDITTGLVGHWALDSDGADASGNAHDGVLSGDASIDTNAATHNIGTGKIALDGADDYLDLSTHATTLGTLPQGTIAGWINTSDTTNTQAIFGVADHGDDFSFATFGVWNGRLFFDVAENDGFGPDSFSLSVNTTDIVADGNWHHVALTIDGTGNAFYIDGVEVGAANLTYSAGSASSTAFLDTVNDVDAVQIGVTGESGAYVYDFSGLIDDVRVYDRALNAADISELVALVPSDSGSAVWSDSSNTPQASDWDGSSFGTSAATVPLDDRYRIVQGADAPTRDEKIVVGVNANGSVVGELWDGSSWTAFKTGATVSETYWYGAEVAYEQVSGDAIVVFNDNSEAAGDKLQYRVWDGTSWTLPQSITAYGGSEPQNMRLAFDPGSDAMVLVVSDSNADHHALVWDGDTWGNAISLDSSGTAESDQSAIAMSFEAQSGNALVTYGKNGDTDVYYRVWDGASWGSEGSLTASTGIGTQTAWLSSANDPNSNRVVLGVTTTGNEAWSAVWNGNAWEAAHTLADGASASTTGSIHPALAVAFESSTGEALVTYGRSGQTEIYYQTWSEGGGWSGPIAGPDLGAFSNSMTLDSGPSSDHVMLSIQDIHSDVHYLRWDGVAWGADNELTTTSGETKNQPFVFIYDQDGMLVDLNTDPTTSGIADFSVNEDPGFSYIDLNAIFADAEDPDTALVYTISSNTNPALFDATTINGSGVLTLDYAADQNGSADITIRATDTGGLFVETTFTVTVNAVNDDPTVINLDGDILNYTEGDDVVIIEQGNDALVGDIDSANFAGGSLNVECDSGLQAAEDVFSIRNQGTGAGQIGVSGSDVTYGGVVIGTFAGGTGLAPLNIVFNANATSSAVTALVQNLTYGNTNTDDPTAGARSVTFDIADGDGGSTLSQNVTVNVSAVNDAPGVAATGTINAYTENDGQVVIDAGLTLSDVDSPNLASAQVRIFSGFSIGEDVLAFTNQLGITGSYNAATGILSLTGSASVADYQTALRSVTYENTSEMPSTTNRVISFQVNDGASNATGMRTVSVASINDDPTNNGTLPSDVTVLEGVSTGVDLSAIDFGDLDHNNQLLTVTLTTSSGGRLFASTDMDVIVSGSGGSIMTLTGGLADLNTFFNSATRIQYLHGTSNTAGDNADTIQVQIRDNGNTGTGGGGNISLGTVNVDITNVNDAPSGTDKTVSTNEDTDYTFTASDFGFVDASDSPANSLANIIISTAPSNGTLYVDANDDGIVDGGESLAATDTIAVAEITAGRLKFKPMADNAGSGYDSFTFKVQDDGGTANSGVDTDASANTITVNVAAVNDAPIRTAGTVSNLTVAEDSGLTSLGLGSVAYGPGGGADESGQTLIYTVTAIPSVAVGNVFLADGTTRVTSGPYSLAQIQGMQFKPADNVSGTTAFQFNVTDSGGTTNGGTDGISQFMTITVTAVNDAPTTSPVTLAPIAEDSGARLITQAELLANASDIEGDGLTATGLTVSAGTGSLVDNGNGTWNYTPAADDDTAVSFSYSITDGTDTTAASASLDITPVNDGPTATIVASGLGVTEDDGYRPYPGLSVSDPDAGSNELAVTLSVNSGIIKLNNTTGVTFTVGSNDSASMTFTGSLTDLNTVLASFSYRPDPDFSGNDTLTLSVDDQGNTGGGALSHSDTANIVVSPINDAPVNTVPGTQTVLEETMTAISGVGIVDIDAAGADVTTRLQVTAGILDVTLYGTATISAGSNGSGDLTIRGTVADINATLASLTYTGNTDVTGVAADTLTVTTDDGGNTGSGGALQDTDTVQINITNVADAPTFGGADTGAVTEDVDPDLDTLLEVSGSLTISDPDAGESSFQAGTVVGTYGSLTIDSAGNWAYEADNTQAAIQQLDVSESLTDTLTVTSFDGTTHDVVITIIGAEDAPVISADISGTVTEDGTLSDSGTLTITDVDAFDNPISFADVPATPGDNGYGSFALSGGTWTYTLNNGNATVQGLGAGDSLTDSHTFTATDGSTQTVIITIDGAEDAPILVTNNPLSVPEESSRTITSAYLEVTDSDNTPTEIVYTLTSLPGGTGAVRLSGAALGLGDTFTQDDIDNNQLSFRFGDDASNTDFKFTVSDGTTTSAEYTFGIIGQPINDAPVNTVPGTQTVLEETTTAISGISIVDIDAAGADVTTRLQATAGTLTVALSGTATISAGSNGSGDLTILGTVADINATLASLTYTGDTDVVGIAADTLTVTTDDGGNTGSGGALTDTDTVQIDITNVNDAAQFSGVDTGSVTEDVDPDTDGLLETGGTLNVTDADAGESSFQPGTIAGAYGSLTIDAAGVWTFSADNSQAAIQLLGAAETLTDTLTVTSFDGTTHDITITINGADDAAVVSGTVAGAVTEGNVGDAPVTASGSINISDTDSSDTPSFADVANTVGNNGYGSFVLSGGTWTYTLDQSAVQDLDAGDVVNDTITYTATDGSTQPITVSITGTDDASVITGAATGAVTEGNVGDAPMTATGSISISDVDADDSPVFNDVPSTVGSNGYGSFALSGGTWTYKLDQSAVQDLDAGDVVNDTITYTATDGSTQPITVSITGTDDTSVITGNATGAVTEGNVGDAPMTATGSISISDVDADDSPVFNDVPSTFGANGYGSFALSGGTWTYTLDQSTVQDLDAGDLVTDTITYTATDGSTQSITVSITGTDDNSVITGTASGAATEGNVGDAPVTATGSISISDVDADDSPVFNDVASTSGDNGYGSFVLTGGTWTYTLDQSAVQYLDAGESVTDTITYTATDGATQVVTVNINGSEDLPTLDNAISDQAATEDSAFSFTFVATTFGDLDASDSLSFTATLSDGVTPLPGWLNFVDNGDGTGTFSGTPLNADVGTVSVRLTASDGAGSAGDTFDIVVGNTNDASVIGGADTGAVTEDVDPDLDTLLEVSGSLTISDPDAGESSFQAGTVVGTYGSLTIDAAGNWAYSADNTQGAIQQLDVAETLTDTLTVTSFDGTTHDVTITINGTEDAPVISGTTTGVVTEGNVGDAPVTSTGSISITDVDGNDTPVFNDVASTVGDNGYGSFQLVSGIWTYTLDQSAVQDLDAGDVVNDTTTFTATGGSTQSITVSITGTDDTSVITGTSTGAVTEGNVGDAPVTATGSIAISDVDADDSPTFNDVPSTVGANGYGSFVLSSGTWTYTLDQSAVQDLDAGDVINDSITYTATDGSTQTVAVSITGTDDTSVITGTATGAATEGNVGDAPVTATGSIAISDVDADDSPAFNDVASTVGDNGYGSFVLTGGNWTYTLDQSAVQDLDAADVVNDTITYTATDGSTQQITVSVTGTDDSSVITGTATGAVTEGNVGDAPVTATGLISISDVDADDSPTFNDVASTVGANGYGSFVLSSGTWTYTLDQSVVQDLDAGDVVNDTITFTATDGSTQSITVSITGTDDAAVITGTATGAVTEGNVGDAPVTTTGSIAISDVDADDSPTFNDVPSTVGANGYGSFVLSSGTWTYTLDQSAVQDLDADDVVNDTITFTATDGSTQQITVSITGTDDSPVITGTATGAVTEGNVGDAPVTATGSIGISDVDADDSPVFNDVGSMVGANGYGSFVLTGGAWAYTLDQSAVQDLDTGDVVTDTITFTATDGTTQIVTITITGTEDAPVIGGVSTGVVAEDTDPDLDTLLEASGALTISDPDAGESSFVAGTMTGSQGYLIIDASGNWDYVADNTQAAIQQLDAGESINDVLTVTTADGTTHDITVTINGAEDAPVIAGSTSALVTEDGTLTATGSLTITDADAADNPVGFPDEASTPGDNGYGDFQLIAGNWSYALNNAHAAVQALAAGASLTDTHTFTASDGSTQVVSIVIAGAAEAVPPPVVEPPVPEPEPIERAAPPPETENPVEPPAEADPAPESEPLTGAPDPSAAEPESEGPAASASSSRLPEPLEPDEIFLEILTDARPNDVQTVKQPAAVAKPTAETAQTFLQELKSFWKEDSTTASIEMSEVHLSKEFWNGLDKMAQDLDESIETEDKKHQLSAEAAAGVSISLTAGFVSWAMRAGSMAASMLAALPTWRHFDPMPVLSADEKKKQAPASTEEVDEETREMKKNERIERLFGED